MEQRNYEFLSDKVLNNNLGFGTLLNDDLMANMKLGKPEFTLHAEGTAEKKKYDFDITNFVRKDDNTFYHLNGPILATVTDDKGQKETAKFNLYFQNGFNVDQMMSILNGRGVHKEVKENGAITDKIYFMSNKKDETGNRIVVSNKLNLTEVFKEISNLPGLTIDAGKKETLMGNILNGKKENVVLNTPNGNREVLSVELSKSGHIAVKNKEGKHVNLSKSSIEFTPAEEIKKRETPVKKVTPPKTVKKNSKTVKGKITVTKTPKKTTPPKVKAEKNKDTAKTEIPAIAVELLKHTPQQGQGQGLSQ